MTAAAHPVADIVADTTVPTIRIIREFGAPVANVFRAHADPVLYARWCGPHELVTTIGEWGCRTGGAWSFQQTDPDGNETDFYGSFHEIRPNELIVQTFTFAGYPDGVSLERLTFDDLCDGRTRLTAVSLVDSFDGRDALLASGMETGIRDGYDKLDDLLTTDGLTAERDR